jgi:ribosomal 30S subunit maturation factor RimM
MTQQHNQRIINLGQVRSNTGIQGWFNIENKCDTSHQQNKREEKKIHD